MKKLLSLVLVLSLVVIATVLPASAAVSQATLELIAGNVEVIDPPGGSGIESKNIDFGSHQITGASVDYNALSNVGLFVSDATGDITSRWNVQFEISNFTDTPGIPPTPVTLAGFTIDLVVVTGSLIGPTTSNPPRVDTVYAVAAGSPRKIFISHTSGSLGQWGTNWTPTLHVIGGTETAANHSAIVTWTVGNTL